MADAPSVLIVDRERFSTLIAKMLSSKFATDTEVEGIQTIKKLRLEMSNIDELYCKTSEIAMGITVEITMGGHPGD